MQTELNKIVTALQEFYARETFLLEKDLGERTLTHRLAVHCEKQFSGWDVDCDFNRLGERTLRLPQKNSSAVSAMTSPICQTQTAASAISNSLFALLMNFNSIAPVKNRGSFFAGITSALAGSSHRK